MGQIKNIKLHIVTDIKEQMARPRSRSSKNTNNHSHKHTAERPRSQSCGKCANVPMLENVPTFPLRKRSISASNLDCLDSDKFMSNKSTNIRDVLDCKSKDEYMKQLCDDREVVSDGDHSRKWSDESTCSTTSTTSTGSTGSPTPRKRKIGFSSFSLSRFVGSKMSLKRRTYQPNDPRQLIIAIRNRDFGRVRYLLESYPIDVNGHDSKGVTAVHEAALDGQIYIIELLLQHNSDVSLVDADGLTCLDYAVFGGHFECAQFLIDHGATVSSVKDGVPI